MQVCEAPFIWFVRSFIVFCCWACQVDFDDLKARMKIRLEKMGIKVTKVLEEEYCLIPMGGVLPTFPQRTLGIGGTAGMVHPSTGCAANPNLHCTLRSVCQDVVHLWANEPVYCASKTSLFVKISRDGAVACEQVHGVQNAQQCQGVGGRHRSQPGGGLLRGGALRQRLA